jgi:membrane protein CcdC involved in cytochrome C biogenesis
VRLYDRIAGAFVWIAAFSLAAGVFLSITLLLRGLPATEPVAVGLVTIERYSKLRDYVSAALFFLLVPPLTIWLHGVLGRAAARLSTTAERLLFTLPFLLSPVFYLTTGKVGWILALPVALAYTGPRALAFARSRRWIRELFRRELGPYHALLFAEAVSWLFFRYLVTARRIAHAPTLFLEVVFVALFLAIFWGAAIVTARLMEMNFGRNAEEVFKRITVAALPLVVLPFLAAAWVPLPRPRLFVAGTIVLIALIAWRLRRPMSPRAAWNVSAYVAIPALIYLFSYCSTAQLSQWVDLFHRGEAIGPASDYLRGKVPFRDVFALHGMLEDGQLDAWLMQLFGRSLDVAILRTVVVGAFLGVAIWFLGIAIFNSIPLALLCVAMGSWTTAENNRTFFQVAAVALFWNALRRRSRLSAVASGVFAGVALFFSYDIGLYTIAGALATALLLWIASKRVPWEGLPPGQAAAFFVLGTVLGAAPFAIYLAMHGALDDFFVTSFVTIPAIIDAVWSLPFPDLVSAFRKNVSMHVLADFVLREKFHLVMSPLVIAIGAVYFIQRWLRRRVDRLDYALLVLLVFATVAQRTAFGRVSFTHQYFAAFLIGPLLVLLGVLLFRTLRKLWHEGSEGTRAFVAAVVAAFVPVVAVLFWIPDLVDVRLHDFTRYYYRILQPQRDAQAEMTYWRIQDVTKAVQELTRRNDPIFDFSNQPAFYFFTDRPNPTRFYQVPILSPPRFQAEAIAALERAKPKVIIRRSPELFDQFDGIPNELRAQAVSAYLDETYHFHRAVRGIELWTRRANAKARPVSAYLGRIRIPEPAELVAGSRTVRMVFPAVGSVPGVGGSYWESDLTLHNPLRDPLKVTLRYVTAEDSFDRRLTLAPRQTLRWPDVVRTLFQAGSSVGALWIEHREGLAPVATVKTSDVAHNARGSSDAPLTVRDSATSQTELDELALVGIPEQKQPGRRVNVGMVNIGIIPATFKVTVRDRTGKLVGTSVESGVPEDNVWLVNDVEHQLGVRLDATMTVRVTVIAGTGVAFASVVEPNGDSEFIAAIPTQQQ